MNIFKKKHLGKLVLASHLFLTGVVVAADDSGRNSHFWITLNPNAGTANAVDSDILMRNGFRQEDGSSSGFSCTRKKSGNSLVYQFLLQHNSFDGSATVQDFKFNVTVEGFYNTKPTYSAVEGESAFSMTGRSSTLATDINNRWGVRDDDDLDPNETLRFTVGGFEIGGKNFNELGYSVKDLEIIHLALVETNAGHSHKVVFGGVSSSESSHIFNTGNSVLALEGFSSPFYVTGAGSSAADRHFAINNISFKFRILNPARSSEGNGSYYSDLISGHQFEKDIYPGTVRFRRNQSFPEFSWDTVPRSLLIRKKTAYTDAEINSIATNYDLVVLEKSNQAGFGTVQAGMLDTAARLKAVNPDIKISFYWNAYIFYDSYGIDDSIYEPENYAEWIDPDNMIRDIQPVYNIESAGMSQWWVGSARTMMANYQIDSVFVDKGATLKPEMAADLFDGLPYDKFNMGNIVRVERAGGNRAGLEYIDGSYFERWQRPREWGPVQDRSHTDTIATQIALMQEMVDKDKVVLIMVDTGGKTREEINDDLDYELAIFLLGAGEFSYLAYQGSVDGTDNQDLWDTSYVDAFSKRLGSPVGNAVRDGAVFTRSFQYADVKVNTENQTSSIDWK